SRTLTCSVPVPQVSTAPRSKGATSTPGRFRSICSVTDLSPGVEVYIGQCGRSGGFEDLSFLTHPPEQMRLGLGAVAGDTALQAEPVRGLHPHDGGIELAGVLPHRADPSDQHDPAGAPLAGLGPPLPTPVDTPVAPRVPRFARQQ